MIIHLIPRRAPADARASTALLVNGERLSVNGVWTDFGPLEEGGIAEHATLEEQDKSLIRSAERIDGVVHAHVVAEIGPEFECWFAPADDPRWTVEIEKGVVAIPATPRQEEKTDAEI